MTQGLRKRVCSVVLLVSLICFFKLVKSAAVHDTQRNDTSAKEREGVVGPNTELGKDAVDWNNGAMDAVNGSVKRDRRSLTSLLAGVDDSASDNNYFVNVGLRQDYLLQHCGDGQHMKLSFPDLDYAFLGYNIFKGYPLAMGSDPGFTYPIFFADYSQNLHTSDCRYSVPRGLVVIPDVSCDVSFTSKVMKNMRSFEREIAASLNVKGDIPVKKGRVGFSLSGGFKHMTAELSKAENTYILSTAKCGYYKSKINVDGYPRFDESFLRWVRRLDKTDSTETYIAFLDKYGTHYPEQVTFGARYTKQYKLTSDEFKEMNGLKIDVEAAASYSAKFEVSGGLGFGFSKREEVTTFTEKAETKVFTVGAAPPADGDAMTWASSVQQNPVPISYELDNIENLFTEKLMKNLGVDFRRIHNNIKDKIDLYFDMIKNKAEEMDDDETSVLIPGWSVKGGYEQLGVSFRDCYAICKGLSSGCVGVSYCKDCGTEGKSICSMFDTNIMSSKWTYNAAWETTMISGPVTLNGFAVADGSQSVLDSVTLKVSGPSQQSSSIHTAQRICNQKMNNHRSGNTVRAVAYSIGFVFNKNFVFCRVHGTRKVLNLEKRDSFDTFINP